MPDDTFVAAMPKPIAERVYRVVAEYGPIGAAGIAGEFGLDALQLDEILRTLLDAGRIFVAGREPAGEAWYVAA